MGIESNGTQSGKAPIVIRAGRIWFSKEMERRFYFVLTVIMLAVGIFYKLGWL